MSERDGISGGTWAIVRGLGTKTGPQSFYGWSWHSVRIFSFQVPKLQLAAAVDGYRKF